MLGQGNPMTSTVRAVLIFEVIVFGLAIPGIVLVEHASAARAGLWCGIAMVLALAGALLLRSSVGWVLAWAAQLAGILLGLLTSMMWFVGGLFALLFAACVVLGRRLDQRRPQP